MFDIVKVMLFIHNNRERIEQSRKQEVVVLEEKGFSIKKHKRSEEIIV